MSCYFRRVVRELFKRLYLSINATGSISNAAATSMNSQKSRRLSPRSYFDTNDWVFPSYFLECIDVGWGWLNRTWSVPHITKADERYERPFITIINVKWGNGASRRLLSLIGLLNSG